MYFVTIIVIVGLTFVLLLAHLIIIFHTTYFSTELLRITSVLRVMAKGAGAGGRFSVVFLLFLMQRRMSVQLPGIF